jgi:hypothetical protein
MKILNEEELVYNGGITDETADPADYIRINTEAVIIA